jgi:hypothetical protein
LLAPDKEGKVRPIPRVSRRAMLASRLTAPAVADFSRNIVNRLWALMMGRGLVHPLDMNHGENPPSHPELLDLMARAFVSSGHDVKGFLRELALTQTYQRSSEPPSGSVSPADTGSAQGPTFGVASVRPMGAEQLGWSVLRVFGYVESYRKQAADRLDGHDPKAQALFRTDPKRQALRDAMIEQEMHAQLEGNVSVFVNLFGSATGQPPDAVSATVDQALFLSNSDMIRSWLTSGSPVINRLNAMVENASVAEELYLTVYGRRPSGDERSETVHYLAERGKDRAAAIQELTWALLASTEFRFNH